VPPLRTNPSSSAFWLALKARAGAELGIPSIKPARSYVNNYMRQDTSVVSNHRLVHMSSAAQQPGYFPGTSLVLLCYQMPVLQCGAGWNPARRLATATGRAQSESEGRLAIGCSLPSCATGFLPFC